VITSSDASPERRALRLSAGGNVFFALLGLGFGWYTGSEAILLDGYFSLVSFGMALVTLRVARLVLRPEDESFHFGYFGFEPLVNVAKGLLILGVCAIAFVSAVGAVLHGGRPIGVGAAVVYSVLATAGAATMTFLQARAARRTGSALLEVDAANWRIDAIMSLVVTAAFGLTLALQRSPWSAGVPYVDPGLVIVLVLAVVWTPMRVVVDGLADLLLAAPRREEQDVVRRRCREVLGRHPVARSHFRMLRVGRASHVVAHVVVEPELATAGVERLDEIRRELVGALAEIDPPWTIDAVFVADEALIYTEDVMNTDLAGTGG
jgi:cation diffusion facilitator family transporter